MKRSQLLVSVDKYLKDVGDNDHSRRKYAIQTISNRVHGFKFVPSFRDEKL
jgi:uncharacterized protein YpbB